MSHYVLRHPKSLNPWQSMWTKPRATIHQIVKTNPERQVLLLGCLLGISQALNRASTRGVGDELGWPLILVGALIFGPLGGLLTLYLGAALLSWTGGWLGGKASPRLVRTAIAWSGVPVIWGMLLWIPEILFFGQAMFTSELTLPGRDPFMNFLFLLLMAAELIIGVWALVVFFKSLSQVQGFSAWTALGNLVLSSLVIIVPLLVLIFGIALLVP